MDSIVIKVKYEKTLRRFNASVVDGRLVLDMGSLRAKVLSLFNLPDGAKFTLRYTDEDGDEVTLADEEDLVDVVKQSLNPLRITVKLNKEKNVIRHESGSSTPAVSPQKQQQPLNDVLKSLVREAFKLLQNKSLQHTNSPQALAELVDSFRKQVVELQSSAESSPKSGGASGRNPDLSVNKDTKGPLKPEAGPSGNSNAEIITLLRERQQRLQVSSPSANSTLEFRDQLQKAGKVVPPPTDVNVMAPGLSNIQNVSGDEAAKRASFVRRVGFHNFTGATNDSPNKNKEKSDKYPLGSLHVGLDRVSGCPYFGNVVGNEFGYPNPSQYARPVLSHPHNVPRSSAIHNGVECDVCGAHPIVGTRFKSVVRHNYDLCSACFEKGANDKDYIRINWPIPITKYGFHSRQMPQHAKLDSVFIQDVNILDGTIMSPSTPFTKIWQMKNNGTTVWPRGTHLMWIGGDKFSNAVSVELEIPKIGLPVGEVLDVAIDFCAPELPGRYISYWRMASPSGQKFGQRVWVLIQVDASLSDAELPKEQRPQNNLNFNLNLPPPTNGSINVPQIVNMNADEPMVRSERSNKGKLVEPLDEDDYYTKKKDEELNFPINNTLLVGGSPSSSTVSYPVVDFSEVEPIVPYSSPAAMDLPVPVTLNTTTTTTPDAQIYGGGGDNEGVEQKLLKELEEMGFKQIDLNKEILRRNEYDLQQSVDDLCGVEEWDPILDELKEMGFCNDEVNKRLLKKNNGSIKRVVMDLINGE